MMERVIGIDLDSTLNRLDKKWLQVYNEEYDDNLTVNDMTCWNWETVVKPECGKKIYAMLHRPGFFADLEVQPDSQEVTKWLIDKGHKLFIVTAYLPCTVTDKVAWASRNYPHIPTDNVIFCNDKSRFNGHFLIDDGGHNADAFTASNPNGKALLYDSPCPWNHYLGDKYPRFAGWKQIQGYFEEVL